MRAEMFFSRALERTDAIIAADAPCGDALHEVFACFYEQPDDSYACAVDVGRARPGDACAAELGAANDCLDGL